MKGLQPVIWMKGTFLSPQHLQAQDRYLENVLRFQTQALAFQPWGFHTLRIDQEALAAGSFALSSATGIFPDGLLFDVPDADAAPLPRLLVDAFEEDQDTLEVILAVPQQRERGLNVAMARNAGAETRFFSEVALLRDENTGLAERPVQVARKNLRFLTSGESLQGSAALPVARVRKTKAGTLELDPQFVPPLLDLRASDFLVSILRRLVEITTAKSAVLGGLRRQKNQSLADFGTADIANFWLLYTVNTALPLLQHLHDARHGHPEVLFAQLLELAGSLTTFSTQVQPRDLPRYNHEDLGTCFRELDEKIRFLLETVVPSNFVSIPLKQVKNTIYAAALAEDRLLQNTRMYLAVHSDTNEGELIQKAPYLVKVCSANHIDHLVQHALAGVTLTHAPRPPAAIPMKLNHTYFSLGQQGPAWDSITRARTFAAYVPAEIPNPQLELIVLLPSAQ